MELIRYAYWAHTESICTQSEKASHLLPRERLSDPVTSTPFPSAGRQQSLTSEVLCRGFIYNYLTSAQ